MGKTYRTAQGRMIDIETIKLKNEMTPALGNMRVNARGDQLGPGGKIIKTREEIMDDFYKVNQSSPEPVSNIPSDGMILPRKKKDEPVATSIKKSRDFSPADITPDSDTMPSGKAAEVEPIKEVKGGLAAAVMKARERKGEKK